MQPYATPCTTLRTTLPRRRLVQVQSPFRGLHVHKAEGNAHIKTIFPPCLISRT